MSAQELAPSRNREVPFLNPWWWMLGALPCVCVALMLAHLRLDAATPFRIILVAAGVLAAGIAVAMRLNSQNEHFLDQLPLPRVIVQLGLAALNVLLILIVFLLLIIRLTTFADLPWRFSSLAIMFQLVFPICGAVAWFSYASIGSNRKFTKSREAAALLVLTAVCACLGGWALYMGRDRITEWDTMRVFLAVFALVALLAAGLALIPVIVRKIVISVFIVVHFFGIFCAILSVPPVPWIVGQLRQRVYRPYLQFMYLENAYQFYAPDPGPANFYWFRIVYERTEKKELTGLGASAVGLLVSPIGQGPLLAAASLSPGSIKKLQHWRWVKFPEMNPVTGYPEYPLGLQYLRRVAFCDQMSGTDGGYPSWFVYDSKGQVIVNGVYYWRIRYSGVSRKRLLADPDQGTDAPAHMEVPLDPGLSTTAQFRQPNSYGQKLIESAARHVCRWKHPDYPEDKAIKVKIYHAIHNWLTPQLLNERVSPTFPTLYQPYYQGEYDTTGKLLDRPVFDRDQNLVSGDPFLHWLMPILPKYNPRFPGDPREGDLCGFVFKHAGDRKYVMYAGTDYWQEPRTKGFCQPQPSK